MQYALGWMAGATDGKEKQKKYMRLSVRLARKSAPQVKERENSMQQKKVSKAGVIGIPKYMRQQTGVLPGSAVDVEVEGNRIIITPHAQLCGVCGSPEEVVAMGAVCICRRCARRALEETGGEAWRD